MKITSSCWIGAAASLVLGLTVGCSGAPEPEQAQWSNDQLSARCTDVLRGRGIDVSSPGFGDELRKCIDELIADYSQPTPTPPAPPAGGGSQNCSISVSNVNGVRTCGGAKAGVTCTSNEDCQAKCLVCTGPASPPAPGPSTPPPAPAPPPDTGNTPPAPPAPPPGNGQNCSISVSNVNGVRTCGGAKAGVTCTDDADCQAKCLVCN